MKVHTLMRASQRVLHRATMRGVIFESDAGREGFKHNFVPSLERTPPRILD